MSTFQVRPNTPYNISIGAPGVAGTPAPTISYAWSYNGTPIGTNSRFVNGYTFPAFPGTLACTITLTNIVGSASQTVTAAIQQASNRPTLAPVTIRNNAAPTVPISTIANGNAGVVLRVGGPNAADQNPVAINASSIAYQWRRGTANIAGATGQTYTMVADDEDSTIACVVTATNPDGSESRTAVLQVGNALPNANSHVGANAPRARYYFPSQAFANMWYSHVRDARRLGGDHLVAGDWGAWDGPETFSSLGWAIQTASGQPIDTEAGKQASRGMIPLIWHEGWRKEVLWDALALRGDYGDTVPDAWLTDSNYPKPRYTNPPGIERTVTFDLTIYWRGTGTCAIELSQVAAAPIPNVPQASEIAEVVFTGPNNEGPWGTNNEDEAYNGPATMKRLTRSYTVNTDFGASMRAGIATSDANDPVRDLILLVSNVRDADTNQLLFAGYDHTNYKPFQIHLPFYEGNKFCKVMRSLNWGLEIQHRKQDAGREHLDYNATPRDVELIRVGGVQETYQWRPLKWKHTHPSGMSRGLGNLSHPGHSLFQASPRALVELCNQLDADIWWCHAPGVAYAGTRVDGVDTPAQLLTDRGELLIDTVHIDGIADLFHTYLKPGLKVWNEYGNEMWNFRVGNSFAWGSAWCRGMSNKTLASVEFGGDGLLWKGEQDKDTRTLQAPAIHAGAETIKANQGSYSERMMQAAASALITKRMRDRYGNNGRQCRAVAAGQSRGPKNMMHGLGSLWLTQPKLFRELDVVAHAPYQQANWNPVFNAKWSSREADINLETLVDPDGDGVAEDPEAAWDWVENVQKGLEPYSVPFGGDINTDSWWGTKTVDGKLHSPAWGLFAFWKSIALDEPHPDHPETDDPDRRYVRRYVPSGWGDRRRWHLELVTYEAGNHYQASRSNAKLFAFQAMLNPRYRSFQRRYLETIFAPFKKGLVRNAQTTEEAELYQPGRVPDGIHATDREPMHSIFTALANAEPPQYLTGSYWGQQWWLGHDGSPQFEILRECAEQGWGEPNWWLTYAGDSE